MERIVYLFLILNMFGHIINLPDASYDIAEEVIGDFLTINILSLWCGNVLCEFMLMLFASLAKGMFDCNVFISIILLFSEILWTE